MYWRNLPYYRLTMQYQMNKPVKITEWMYDMSANENGNIELLFIHEGVQYTTEITEKDVRSLTHLFQLFKN
jgi:hypothetical protein